MSPDVYRVFESICTAAAIKGEVLEVGAVAGPDSLLRMPCLHLASRRIGINLAQSADDAQCQIIQGNANHMPHFTDGQFEAVLCNSTLEHDPYFWKTLTEIHRVTAPGGLIAIGVPSYGGMGAQSFLRNKPLTGWLLKAFAHLINSDVLRAGTVTLGEHLFPGDYYRFSEQAMREIFLADLVDIEVCTVMQPPRLIGWGRKL